MPTLLAHLLTAIFVLIGAGALGLLAWKHIMVLRFFRRPHPGFTQPPQLVSVLQPILSGDPTLQATLEHNLMGEADHPVEFVWLVDETDLVAQDVCGALQCAHPERAIQLLSTPLAPQGSNPKTFKLAHGIQVARGDIICVLDDDTLLPEGWMADCLPYLDQPGAGLVFGLPYQINFSNLWSSLVAYFVNSNSLLTYVPYAMVHSPVTINGMFYAARRAAWAAVGEFTGLEPILADDFAVAQRFRQHGLALVQSPLRHAIRTQVRDAEHYVSLLQRWFIFPRESLLRHLAWQEQALVYVLALAPAVTPLLLLIGLLIVPSVWTALLLALYLLYAYGIFAQFNLKFLNRASPWRSSWQVLLLQLVFPLQLLAALLLPQRIIWRGHRMQVEKGGGFRYVKRREET